MSTQSNNFKKALAFTLKWEGGYVNNPDDPGGATNQGITQRTYDLYRKDHNLPPLSVKHIQVPEVEKIYADYYWLPARCESLPLKNAIATFDFAVHSGVRRALKYYTGDLPRYINLRESFLRKQDKPMFLPGWLNRLKALRKEVGAV